MSTTHGSACQLPLILAGPILRRASAQRLVIWFVTSQRVRPAVALYPGDAGAADDDCMHQVGPDDDAQPLSIGTHAYVYCLDMAFGAPTSHPELPEDVPIGYELRLFDEAMQPLTVDTPALTYAGEVRPRFVIRRRVTGLLHGSCRRPHHASGDGMTRADDWLAQRRANIDDWPTAMLLSGDQIYADDVAGPMLHAIHQLISRLGLHGETIRGATVNDDQALFEDSHSYYQREHLLPHIKQNTPLRERFFGGTRKPVFTSVSAHNHLITLSEVLAMYLLVWSDVCWQLVDMTRPRLSASHQALFDEEAHQIQTFAAELPKTRRLLAHVPTAMIFDDHDVTDDWNMTAQWEAMAYQHPFSRRILGNALLGYFVCQGWGNAPEVFTHTLLPQARAFFEAPTCERHDELIDALLRFENWHYTWPTQPAIVVLDTRTRRWRSERNRSRPSGLMDWEALCEMQQGLMDRSAVIMVSPTPVFGVKLIENIQRVFTWLGRPLMVDAENWMGHRGAAQVLLHILGHTKTPEHFTVLSGDVHYSFAYDVTLRFGEQRRPRIWQITSSGVKNEFPERLLDWFDRLNRWLFAPYSPLNWLTKRRRMRIVPRKPQPSSRGERLVNSAGMGYIHFDDSGRPAVIKQLGANGTDVVFRPDTGTT